MLLSKRFPHSLSFFLSLYLPHSHTRKLVAENLQWWSGRDRGTVGVCMCVCVCVWEVEYVCVGVCVFLCVCVTSQRHNILKRSFVLQVFHSTKENISIFTSPKYISCQIRCLFSGNCIVV